MNQGTAANRIDETFRRLRAEGKKAFVAYVCAGDPHLDALPGIVAVTRVDQSSARTTAVDEPQAPVCGSV